MQQEKKILYTFNKLLQWTWKCESSHSFRWMDFELFFLFFFLYLYWVLKYKFKGRNACGILYLQFLILFSGIKVLFAQLLLLILSISVTCLAMVSFRMMWEKNSHWLTPLSWFVYQLFCFLNKDVKVMSWLDKNNLSLNLIGLNI